MAHDDGFRIFDEYPRMEGAMQWKDDDRLKGFVFSISHG